MPLEVRELVVKVNVGSAAPAASHPLREVELAAFKREVIEECLAELRQRLAARDER